MSVRLWVLLFVMVIANLYFFIAYLQKCNKINKKKLGNNTVSNFSSSCRPQDLGGTFTCFFAVSITKTHNRYPITLNGQTRKM